MVLDGSLGPAGPAPTNPAGEFEIGEALGERRGGNLFHSFGQFSLTSSETARFTAVSPLERVIGRVTSGTRSLIRGRIVSDIPGADLFLLNPAGIALVGPQIDVDGSFQVSTANQLEFADGLVWSTSDAGDVTLTSAAPRAFGFLGQGAEPLAFTSAAEGPSLRLPAGAGLTLAGRDVQVRGSGEQRLAIEGGRIRLIGAAPGERVPIEGPLPSPPADAGPVLLAAGPILDVRRLVEQGPAGEIQIRGGRLEMEGGQLLAGFLAVSDPAGPGIELEASESLSLRDGARLVSQNGAPIRLEAPRLELQGALIAAQAQDARSAGVLRLEAGSLRVLDSALQIEAQGESSGGAISIQADALQVEGASTLATRNQVGAGAPIELSAVEIRLSGPVIVQSLATDQGRGGDLSIAAGSVRLEGEALVEAATSGSASAGDLRVVADRLSLDGLDGKAPAALRTTTVGSAPDAGRSGDLHVSAGMVSLERGAQLSTTTRSAGAAGDLRLAADRVTLRGGSVPQLTGLFANSGSQELPDAGRGGSVRVEARELSLENGSVILARTFGAGDAGEISIDVSETIDVIGGAAGPSVIATRAAFGAGGSIRLRADQLRLEQGGQLSSTTGASGRAGDLEIEAREITIEGRDPRPQGEASAIFAQAATPVLQAGGDGGDVRITVGETLRVADGGRIEVSTSGGGRGGTLRIEGGDRIELRGDASLAAASLAVGQNPENRDLFPAGAGGSIEVIGARQLVLRDGARISTSASGNGAAGAIGLEVDRLRMDGASLESRAEDLGAGGTIRIDAQGGVALGGGSAISAESTSLETGAGDAGAIQISSRGKLEASDSRIETRAAASLGGDLRVGAGEGIELLRSRIETSVATGVGSGGNIQLGPSHHLVLNRSEVRANANQGPGGNIELLASNLFRSSDSTVDASSELGIDGTVRSESPVVDLSADLVTLPKSFVEADRLLAKRCEERGERRGSFTVRASGFPDSPQRVPSLDLVTPAVAAGAAPGDVALAQLARAETLGRAGANRSALAVLEQSEPAIRAAGDGRSRTEAIWLGLRGRTRRELGEPEGAREDLESAASRLPTTDPLRAPIALDLAGLLAAQGDWVRADDAYAAIEERTERPDARAAAAAGRALVRLRRGDRPGAEAHIAQMLAALERMQPSRERRLLRLHAARLLHALAVVEPGGGAALRSRAARLYAEELKGARSAADPDAESFAFGFLAQLYAEDGRSDEALELTDRALDAAARSGRAQWSYLWRWQAARLHAAAGRRDRALESYRGALESLGEARIETLTLGEPDPAGAGDAGYPRLLLEYVDLLLQRAGALEPGPARRAAFLEARRLVDELSAVEIREYFADECLAAQKREAPDAIPGAVVLYPVLLDDRIELIVTLPTGVESVRVPLTREALGASVAELRRRLEERTTHRYREPAAELYEALIRPIDGALEAARPQALVIVPTGPLRSVPLAALWDARAKRFLVERYPIAVSAGLTLTDPRPLPQGNVRALKAGVSRGVGRFSALPNVPRELEAVGESFAGPTLLDEQFHTDTLAAELAREPYDVLHIASHAEFGGRPEDQFVLTYEERMRLDDLAALVAATRFRDRPLELLSLSACETAAGDDKTGLGLSGIALRAGARSTLGTLWPVDDRATALLVETFYRGLAQRGTSRAGALRDAQLALLGERAYRHPGYWSAFVLIGSWL